MKNLSNGVRSHKPLLFLFTKMLRPLSGKLQVMVWLMGFVVQIQTSHSLLRHGSLDLSSLMPFIKWGYRDDIRPHGHRRLQRRLVISPVHAVACIVIVPGTDGGVYVTRASARHEQQVALVAESFDSFPVLVRSSEGETVGGKISVHAVKTSGQDVILVPLFNDERNEDAVVRGSSETVRPSRGEQLGPGLGWGQVRVVHVEERKDLPSAALEPVESTVFAVSVKRFQETNCLFMQRVRQDWGCLSVFWRWSIQTSVWVTLSVVL